MVNINNRSGAIPQAHFVLLSEIRYLLNIKAS